MKKTLLLALGLLHLAGMAGEDGSVVSAAGIAGDGSKPCSDAIQRLIDANPNREIFFPDGTYLLDKPVCTPAHPQKSVSLRLSAYAKFKAVPNWTNTEAMVRLGAIHPANNIMLPGSCYWLKGGIVDGSGVADGVSIDGGRETVVADLSMKGVRIGLRVKYGANSGSADSDVQNVNVVCNGAEDSVGVLVDGFDTTFSKMRIYGARRGMVINGGGCSCRDIHPLFALNKKQYPRSVGFEVNAPDVFMDFCYSDEFATGFLFGKRGRGVLDKCFVFWWKTDEDMSQAAFASAGKFNAKVRVPVVGFRNRRSPNALLRVGEPGGNGYLQDPTCDFSYVNDPAKGHEAYLK